MITESRHDVPKPEFLDQLSVPVTPKSPPKSSAARLAELVVHHIRDAIADVSQSSAFVAARQATIPVANALQGLLVVQLVQRAIPSVVQWRKLPAGVMRRPVAVTIERSGNKVTINVTVLPESEDDQTP